MAHAPSYTGFYTGCPLDRAARRRRDRDWVHGRRQDPLSRVLPLWQEHHPFLPGDPPAPLVLMGEAGRELADRADHLALLGVDEGDHAWFAADLSSWDEGEARSLSGTAELAELRRFGPLLARGEAAILAYARGLLVWHRRHRFCGACGHPTESREAGHLRACTHGPCASLHFPRTDPAVIMLVTRADGDGGACLLGRQARWPRGMFSTLAGFVEPGETLEETVRREVLEEAGVTVDHVHYRGSQPWPFPSSLMLGFRAILAAGSSGELNVDTAELEDARWFTRDDIRSFPERGLRIPRRDSIAHTLLAEWLAEDGGPAVGVSHSAPR